MPIRPATRRQQPDRLAGELAKIDVHADGEEEHAEQQALERLDRRFDGLAILGFRQQQAGNEGAERHGQPRHACGDAGADDHEQDGGHEQLAGAGRRHQAEQRPQQQPADNDNEGERQGRLGHGQHDAVDDRAAHAVAENGRRT